MSMNLGHHTTSPAFFLRLSLREREERVLGAAIILRR